MTAWAGAAAADAIRLRNGDTIHGAIIRETQRGVIVRVGRNQEIFLAYGEIAEVRRAGEDVPLGGGQRPGPSATRDPVREQALIRQYSKALEREYRVLHPSTARIPYAVKREQFDPVRAAKRYGLPVSQAESNKALERMFELTLRCFRSNEAPPWRRTLLFYNKPRAAYIDAISRDIELANIYLDYPDTPYLLNLKEG